MDNHSLAELLFPGITETIDDLLVRFPARSLPEGAKVTRFAPSPTGFMHIGNLYGALTDERLAHQSGGVFYLRIEDTDEKRAVENGVANIIDALSYFGVNFDEGATPDGDNGAYGPYRQRQRESIYKVFVKRLVEEGRAYPCFCTEEELSALRERQQQNKLNFGYYGEFAVHRDTPVDEVKSLIAAGKPYVVRFRSVGTGKQFVFRDEIKGEINVTENDMDIVLLKSDGIPTYHMAHIVDDTLMRTTHVVRGDEWLATLPVHLELFRALSLKPPKYAHTTTIMKQDGDSKRKLSKRKDPEAALSYYAEKGYPVMSAVEYLMTLLNSNYEEWRIKNPGKPYTEFPFSLKKMGTSGALFDLNKLNDVSRDTIAVMDTETVYKDIMEWAKRYDNELFSLFNQDTLYAKSILSIGRECPKPRKDFACFSEVKGYVSFFFDGLFEPEYTYPSHLKKEQIDAILSGYRFNPSLTSEEWFADIKALAERLGFAGEVKAYKQNPDAYPGHVGDVSMVLRVAVTGRQSSPDLCTVMGLLGADRVSDRLNRAKN